MTEIPHIRSRAALAAGFDWFGFVVGTLAVAGDAALAYAERRGAVGHGAALRLWLAPSLVHGIVFGLLMTWLPVRWARRPDWRHVALTTGTPFALAAALSYGTAALAAGVGPLSGVVLRTTLAAAGLLAMLYWATRGWRR